MAAPQAEPAGAVSDRVRIAVWDLPLRLFHWLLVASVSAAIVTGQLGGNWMVWHGRAGLAIIGLLVFRLLWGVVGSRHARFASFVPGPRTLQAYLRRQWQGVGHNPLGALSVLAMLGVLAVQAVLGLWANDDIAYTGPLAERISTELSSRLTHWHHLIADGLLFLLGAHLLAIVLHRLLKRDNLVGPMLTGHKEVEARQLPPSQPEGWRGGRLALAVALAAAVSAVLLASGALLPEPVTAAVAQQPQPAAAW